MGHLAAATRYARALLDVSIKEGDPIGAERELTAFVELLTAHPSLERVLLNPAVPALKKQAVVAELTKRGGASPVVTKLLLLLAGRDRLALLSDLLNAYRARLLDYQQIVRAEVTTAVTLPDDRVGAIARGLAEVTGKKVTVATRVDPEIIGGVVTRIGSTIYDGSISTQLRRMKEKFVERA